jgi:hypothetical protein
MDHQRPPRILSFRRNVHASWWSRVERRTRPCNILVAMVWPWHMSGLEVFFGITLDAAQIAMLGYLIWKLAQLRNR